MATLGISNLHINALQNHVRGTVGTAFVIFWT